MLMKFGAIAYQTTDMRGLFYVAQNSRTSALSQVTIRPGSAPLQVERVAGEGIKNSVEMRDNRLSERRHARTILRRSDASDLCSLPGALASFQIIQASHTRRLHEWARKDDDEYYDKSEEEDILVVEAG